MGLSLTRMMSIAGILLVSAVVSRAGPVSFEQRSEPPGLIADVNASPEAGIEVSTVNAPAAISGFRFGYWTLNNQPFRDGAGRGATVATFTISEPTLAIGWYFPESQDLDGDFLLDWWEWNRLGTLSFEGTGNPDGDDFDLTVEQRRGYDPNLENELVPGGAARSESAAVVFNNPASHLSYSFFSNPAGLIFQRGVEPAGTLVHTPNLSGQMQGWVFVEWRLNGVRQASPSGAALSRVSFSLVQDQTAYEAVFVREGQDSDADGLLDDFEFRQFGDLSAAPDSNNDGDGFDVGTEIARGYESRIRNEMAGGGIARSESAVLSFHRPPGLYRWEFTSSPGGLQSDVGFDSPGTVISTPNLRGVEQGHEFILWTVNGVEQRAPNGMALTQARFTLQVDRTVANAVYLPEGQSLDGDELDDAYELRQFGTLTHDLDDDPDGDGVQIGQELARGWAPAIFDEMNEGGISRSESITVAFRNPAVSLSYTISSNPSGLIASSGGTVPPGTEVATPVPPLETSGNSFIYWTVNGVPVEAPDGSHRSSFTTLVTQDGTAIVAHYIPTDRNSDGDELDDWFELRNFGTLEVRLDSDTEGDGYELKDEFRLGLSPTIFDGHDGGGIARTETGPIAIHMPPSLFSYRVSSDPAGFVASEGAEPPGTEIVTPSFHEDVQGYRFTHWTLNESRVSDPSGAGLSRLVFALTEDQTRVVAHYLPTTRDSDVDLIPDWYEVRWFGGLGYGLGHDFELDGFSNALEIDRGQQPNLRDEFVGGGIARSESAPVDFYDPTHYFTYRMISSPTGLVEERARVQPGEVVNTPNLAGVQQGYAFGFWTVDGSRRSAPDGSALSQISVPILQDGTLIQANFFAEGADSDTDGLLDWYEWQHFGGLSQDLTTNADGDEFANGDEIARGLPATVPDETVTGGVARTESKGFIFYDPGVYVNYEITSVPTGFTSESGFVDAGTIVTTDYFNGVSQGFGFAFWAIDGVRQAGPNGVAYNQLSVVLNRDQMRIVAHFLPQGEDSDGDGILDFQEQFWSGTLDHDLMSDPDSDGFRHGVEIDRGYSVMTRDELIPGGVARTESATVTIYKPNLFTEYLIRTTPAGIYEEFGALSYGTVIEVPNLAGEWQGFIFSYWTVNGSLMLSPAGANLYQFDFALNESVEIVGHFFAADLDTDADHLLDWYEWHHFNTLSLDGSDNPDGDSFDITTETARGYAPRIYNELVAGGIARSESVSVSIDLRVLIPSITAVSPNPAPLFNGKQPFSIHGADFDPNCTVTLRDLRTGEVFPNRAKVLQTSSRIDLSLNFTAAPTEWGVEVINPGPQTSGPFFFNVGQPMLPGITVESLTISGPTSVPAGTQTEVFATLNYFDSTTADVGPHCEWSVVGTAPEGTGFRGPNFVGGIVDQDTVVSVVARLFSSGGQITSLPYQIRITPALFAKISWTIVDPETSAVRLDATALGASGNVTYRWDLNGDGSFDDAEGSSILRSFPGFYGTKPVYLRATDDAGKEDQLSANLSFFKPLSENEPVSKYQSIDHGSGQFYNWKNEPTESFPIDPSKKEHGLVVIVHGLNIKDDTAAAQRTWMKNMASAIRSQTGGHEPNILVYDWLNDANPSRNAGFDEKLERAESILKTTVRWYDSIPLLPDSPSVILKLVEGNTDAAEVLSDLIIITDEARNHGVDLGIEIKDMIANGELSPPSNATPMHLIGHSAGGYVVGECAKFLRDSGYHVDMITMLDTPIPKLAHLPPAGSRTTLERYITSVFGKDILASDFDFSDYEYVFNQSDYAYANTTPSYIKVAENPRYRRREWMWEGKNFWHFVTNHSRAHQEYQSTIEDPNSRDSGFRFSPFRTGSEPEIPNFSQFAPSQDPVSNAFNIVDEEGVMEPFATWSVFGDVEPLADGFRLVEDANVGIFASLDVPIGAQLLHFDLQFEQAGAGDYLQVLWEGIPLFTVFNQPSAQEYYKNYSVPVSAISGVSGELVFKIVSRGVANSVARIGNFSWEVFDDPDGDSIDSPTERANGTDPLRYDSDVDGLSDSEEEIAGTNPSKFDSDGDGAGDGAEIKADTDPKDPTSRFILTETRPSELGHMVIRWASEPGKRYRVLRSFHPDFGTFVEVGSRIVSQGAETTFTDTLIDASANAMAFYVVVLDDEREDP